MGLNQNGARFLLYARSLGADFSRTATIGRQSLHLYPTELGRTLRDFGYPTDRRLIHSLLNETDGYADSVLRHLGAATVHSFDASDYEGATHIHDMNYPIPEQFKNGYSVVLDGGSLEHVFNFPQAMRNAMEMVAPGGHYLAIAPADNLLGHGFYQFSPELFFRVFTETNCYRLLKVIAFEDRPHARWFGVRDPVQTGARTTLVGRVPVYLCVIARRIADGPILLTMPQQSDYVPLWDSQREKPTQTGPSIAQALKETIRKRLPDSMRRRVERARATVSILLRPKFDPRFFDPIPEGKPEPSD